LFILSHESLQTVHLVHDAQEAFKLDMFHIELLSATTEGGVQKIFA